MASNQKKGKEAMGFEHLLAARTLTLHDNAIREILKVVSRPGMISLAGGIPAPESFPMEIMDELSATVIRKYRSAAFQYDLTEGFMPLRKALAAHLAGKGVAASPEEIIIASGSQGFLDAVGKVLISRGDRVAVEAPTYLGAISAFAPYGPRYVRLETDDDGVVPEALDRTLASGNVKFVYLVPTFQNPTGRTLPLARRREIARIIQKYDALLVEDDPYSDLRYRGEPLPSVKSFAPDHVLYISTLSKILAPGLRIGFSVAPRLIRKWLVRVKQGTDLHTATFSQALAAEYLSGGYLDRHLPDILSLYRPRQEAMLAALEDFFPEGIRWSRPEGGMFIWAEGPVGLDMAAVYRRAVVRNTAFVPGRYFYTNADEGRETMRLNFTMAGEAEIRRAVAVLGEEIAEETHKPRRCA
jgi:2-aminoadipate transaminase